MKTDWTLPSIRDIERQIFVNEYGEEAAAVRDAIERLENELADARQRLMWSKAFGKATRKESTP